MQTGINSLDRISKSENDTLASYYVLNLPDLHFYDVCHLQYQVNRGVFNTIDDWFFSCGFEQIVRRRLVILQFLAFAKAENDDHSTKFLKFGPGGLVKKLNDFVHHFLDEGESL